MRLLGAVIIALLAVLAATYSRPAFAAENLSLEQFLEQVEKGNDEFKGQKANETAGELRTREYKLLFLPTLVGEYSDYRDERQPSNAFQGFKTSATTYWLGVQQNFGVGLDATFKYEYVDTTITGASPAFLPEPHYITAAPILELSGSLWRNFLGSETSALKDVSNGGALALKYGSTFARMMVKARAEAAYWRLATARKLVFASQDNLKRSERIQSWSGRRSRLSLSDKSDLLQANATVAARKIELQSALDEEKAAARDFNLARGRAEEIVPEQLQSLETEQITQLPLPVRNGQREDVLASQQEARVAAANAKLSEEKAKPDIDVYAKLSFNGRDDDRKGAMDESWKSDYPFNVVGVRLNMPLHFGIASDIREGYRAQARGAQYSFERKAFEGEKNWQSLSQQFEDAKKRLTLASEMEKAQKGKLDYERQRFGRGRTTTYQVILFEQDFASAQVARLNLEREILDLYAQLKTYGGAK
jgi:outer membrane protein TolC